MSLLEVQVPRESVDDGATSPEQKERCAMMRVFRTAAAAIGALACLGAAGACLCVTVAALVREDDGPTLVSSAGWETIGGYACYSGVIENRTDATLRDVLVHVNFRDESGRVCGSALDGTSAVGPRSRWKFCVPAPANGGAKRRITADVARVVTR
jgi:hypothetical protein